MQLTPEIKAEIDSYHYDDLLQAWRFAPLGDPWFEGESGKYWLQRMKELEDDGADHVGASKRIGW